MKKKILIVDDEPNIVMSLEYAFKKKDYEVYIARDGTEALQIAQKELPQLVLLDIMMPNMDGCQTLKRIRENQDLQQTRVMFISAKSKMKDVEKGLSLGADAYVTKPFSVKKLIKDAENLMSSTK